MPSGHYLHKKRGPLPLEWRKKLSQAHKGKIPWNKGKKMTEEQKRKLSISHKKNPTRYWLGKRGVYSGEKHHSWKGGITPENQKIRHSLEYKIWRRSVFERDRYTCVWCGIKNGGGKSVRLEADHIKPFAYYPELRFAIDNGRTLCKSCHDTTKWGRSTNKT